jgi:outer membrane protein OmpA-like peptidoglycan-associated protein
MRAKLLPLAVAWAIASGSIAPWGSVEAAAPERIPFVKGLTTVRIATSPVGDYETLRTVTDVSDQGYRIVTTGESPADDGDGLIPVDLARNVRAIDQLHSRNVRIAWHTSDRENMTGNVPGVSCDIFTELRATGKAELTYVDVAALVGIATTRARLKGVVKVIDRKPYTLLVNRKQVALPALHVSGEVSDDDDSEEFEFHVIDDPDNPMMLDARIGDDDARVVSIEFPPPGAALERSLMLTEKVELGGIYFKFASATLRPQSDTVLGELAGVLKSHPDWRFRIDGHTDSIGGEASNLDLSARRSAAVRTALVERFGVATSQLTTRGFGESQPIDSNDTDAGRARNRRVELVRLSPAGAAVPPRQVAAAVAQPGSACRFGTP